MEPNFPFQRYKHNKVYLIECPSYLLIQMKYIFSIEHDLKKKTVKRSNLKVKRK